MTQRLEQSKNGNNCLFYSCFLLISWSICQPVYRRLNNALFWFLSGFPSCLVIIPSVMTTLHQAHWIKASVQVNQELAGQPGARISQSLPELQESRLDLRRNRVTCSNTKSSFRARLGRPRSSTVRWQHGADWLQRAPRWGTAVNTWRLIWGCRPTSVIQCQEGARGDDHCVSTFHVGPPTERHRFTRGRHFNPNRWVSDRKRQTMLKLEGKNQRLERQITAPTERVQ
ncbi:uncharacterized protein LOC116382895 isoform X2 [Anarrhichthys ocellatus]|nr:uncharacterized protein LOC116382895 isoform X2 [Anarrhichthys ocellatus]